MSKGGSPGGVELRPELQWLLKPSIFPQGEDFPGSEFIIYRENKPLSSDGHKESLEGGADFGFRKKKKFFSFLCSGNVGQVVFTSYLKKKKIVGVLGWLISAQVMISQFVGLPCTGLYAESAEPAGDSLSPSLPLPRSCSLSHK